MKKLDVLRGMFALAVTLFWLAAVGDVFGQTAKVVALSKEDAATAARLYAAKADIEKQLKELDAKIQREYIAAKKPQDWPWGFQLSDDYKYVVPAEAPKYTQSVPTCCTWSTLANPVGAYN
jgi:hypothetical protein